MDDGQRKGIQNALRVVFTPIVKILLHYRASYKELAEILKGYLAVRATIPAISHLFIAALAVGVISQPVGA